MTSDTVQSLEREAHACGGFDLQREQDLSRVNKLLKDRPWQAPDRTKRKQLSCIQSYMCMYNVCSTPEWKTAEIPQIVKKQADCLGSETPHSLMFMITASA